MLESPRLTRTVVGNGPAFHSVGKTGRVCERLAIRESLKTGRQERSKRYFAILISKRQKSPAAI